ncbi:MAG: hypothetical protein ACKVOX_05755 [Rhizobacter sp.]
MPSLMRALMVFLSVLCGSAADAQVLHFTVTGDYLAQTVIAYQETGGQATVKDRVVLDFDKNSRTGQIGPVSIRNFPSESKDFRNVERSCPPPAPQGTYEHIEVTSAVYDGSGVVALKGARSYPEVQVTAYCQGSWARKTIRARQEQVIENVALIDGDEPTVFSIKLDNGWTWTYLSKKVGK